jgi:4-carboxymuconolactone decarboxylase
MPRIAAVTGKSDVPAEFHGVVDEVLKVFGTIRGPFSILLHSPKLAERLLKLVTFNREDNVVEPKLRSVAILSAVREREAAYVWAAQVGAARRAGLRNEVIDLLRAKGDPASLPDEERDIVIFVRQLMRTNRGDQAVFDRLNNRHDAQWMVELTEVANYFAFLSGMVNPFEVPAPPDGDKSMWITNPATKRPPSSPGLHVGAPSTIGGAPLNWRVDAALIAGPAHAQTGLARGVERPPEGWSPVPIRFIVVDERGSASATVGSTPLHAERMHRKAVVRRAPGEIGRVRMRSRLASATPGKSLRPSSCSAASSLW